MQTERANSRTLLSRHVFQFNPPISRSRRWRTTPPGLCALHIVHRAVWIPYSGDPLPGGQSPVTEWGARRHRPLRHRTSRRIRATCTRFAQLQYTFERGPRGVLSGDLGRGVHLDHERRQRPPPSFPCRHHVWRPASTSRARGPGEQRCGGWCTGRGGPEEAHIPTSRRRARAKRAQGQSTPSSQAAGTVWPDRHRAPGAHHHEYGLRDYVQGCRQFWFACNTGPAIADYQRGTHCVLLAPLDGLCCLLLPRTAPSEQVAPRVPGPHLLPPPRHRHIPTCGAAELDRLAALDRGRCAEPAARQGALLRLPRCARVACGGAPAERERPPDIPDGHVGRCGGEQADARR